MLLLTFSFLISKYNSSHRQAQVCLLWCNVVVLDHGEELKGGDTRGGVCVSLLKRLIVRFSSFCCDFK